MIEPTASTFARPLLRFPSPMRASAVLEVTRTANAPVASKVFAAGVDLSFSVIHDPILVLPRNSAAFVPPIFLPTLSLAAFFQ